MKITKDAIEFSLDEMGALLGGEICKTCATLLPLPKWAYEKNKCEGCKDYPFYYDHLTGENVKVK